VSCSLTPQSRSRSSPGPVLQSRGGSFLESAEGAAPTRDAGPPPRGLACLTTWYAGEVVHVADPGWGFAVDGGTVLPWRVSARARVSRPDGGEDDESEEVVDLESIYRVPYVAGPIVILDASDAGALDDPGRVRIEQLFLTTYGQSRPEVVDHLGKVRFFGLRYPFHELAAEPLRRVVARSNESVIGVGVNSEPFTRLLRVTKGAAGPRWRCWP
jgi:hypothetical protein